MTSPTKHSLSILLWNNNKLIPHINKLDILPSDIGRIDIGLIKETHFMDRSYLRIWNYTYTGRTTRTIETKEAWRYLYETLYVTIKSLPFTVDFLQASSVLISCPFSKFTISVLYFQGEALQFTLIFFLSSNPKMKFSTLNLTLDPSASLSDNARVVDAISSSLELKQQLSSMTNRNLTKFGMRMLGHLPTKLVSYPPPPMYTIKKLLVVSRST